MKSRALSYLNARIKYHKDVIDRIQSSANPDLTEIARNREDVATLEEIVPFVQGIKELDVAPGKREKDIEAEKRTQARIDASKGTKSEKITPPATVHANVGSTPLVPPLAPHADPHVGNPDEPHIAPHGPLNEDMTRPIPGYPGTTTPPLHPQSPAPVPPTARVLPAEDKRDGRVPDRRDERAELKTEQKAEDRAEAKKHK